jgi:hypothetical protein
MQRMVMKVSGTVVAAVSLLAGCNQSAVRPATTDAERTAAQAYGSMLIYDKRVQASLTELGSSTIAVSKVPDVIASLCKGQCESAYLRCAILSTTPDIQIPGRDERAPKDFPIEIPSIEVDEGGNPVAVNVGPAGANCESIKQACLRACACRSVTLDGSATAGTPRRPDE